MVNYNGEHMWNINRPATSFNNIAKNRRSFMSILR